MDAGAPPCAQPVGAILFGRRCGGRGARTCLCPAAAGSRRLSPMAVGAGRAERPALGPSLCPWPSPIASCGPPSCRGAHGGRCALGHGGGGKMRGAFLRGRRASWRSQGARFYRDAAAGAGRRADRRAALSGPARGVCEPVGGPIALDGRGCAILPPSLERACARPASGAGRAVSRTRAQAWPLHALARRGGL